MITTLTTVLAISLLTACGAQNAAQPAAPEPPKGMQYPEPVVEKVLTKQEQDALTPAQVIKALQDGNARFIKGTLTVRDHSEQVRASAYGQYPKAAILSCVDSRVPVEDVFDRGIGDIFVARVAGNFENTDIVGSMEFATKVAGAKVIMVLGHERCGAIKGAIDNVQLGNLTATLSNITPAIQAQAYYNGEKSSKNPEYVHMVAEENVRITMRDIKRTSPVLAQMVDAGELEIVGAMYDLDSGVVTMVDPGVESPSPGPVQQNTP